MSKTFPVLGIERLRIATDGEGVTTLVAAAGCPLRCKYCLNPHSWNGNAKIRAMDVETLIDAVKIDSLYFIATNGGVTFGGGEPLMYADFIAEFREKCPPEWRLYAETSLNVPRKNIETASRCIDTFIADIKDMNPEIYQSYTGQSNVPVLDNLKYLLGAVGAEHIVARVPNIPDFNTPADAQKSVAALTEMGVTRTDLFDYIKDVEAYKNAQRHYHGQARR